MTTGIAESFDQKIRGTVDHFGLIGEVCGRVYEACQLHDAAQAVEVPVAGCFQLSQQADRAGACGGGAVFERHVISELADDHSICVAGNLARNKNEISRLYEGDVVGGGRRSGWQGDAEFGKAGFEISSHCFLRIMSWRDATVAQRERQSTRVH